MFYLDNFFADTRVNLQQKATEMSIYPGTRSCTVKRIICQSADNRSNVSFRMVTHIYSNTNITNVQSVCLYTALL